MPAEHDLATLLRTMNPHLHATPFVFCSVAPEVYDTLGVSPIGMFHEEDQPRAWERWRYSLETGEPYEIEYRFRGADGAYRWFLGRALPMRDASGRIVRWFGTCTDIQRTR